ncbi:hypothetical protein BEWA_054380 [Theileria equi strain WA]|uniref:Signal peptide containing protein n=1 Tax=Theileria equi strain WA TaxID=1537102 RepID=L1LD71_THEEQ|nr:hypothetical protein BEWA_054380 [Theileria equi strain WA]EKX73382.1 hypothetical protein BEWA_054380 [Theileria equi strain WA]|eukprot:XP_004832834.1 hypothetical protein BEWA_054380 [Theileria equi strain WA]
MCKLAQEILLATTFTVAFASLPDNDSVNKLSDLKLELSINIKDAKRVNEYRRKITERVDNYLTTSQKSASSSTRSFEWELLEIEKIKNDVETQIASAKVKLNKILDESVVASAEIDEVLDGKDTEKVLEEEIKALVEENRKTLQALDYEHGILDYKVVKLGIIDNIITNNGIYTPFKNKDLYPQSEADSATLTLDQNTTENQIYALLFNPEPKVFTREELRHLSDSMERLLVNRLLEFKKIGDELMNKVNRVKEFKPDISFSLGNIYKLFKALVINREDEKLASELLQLSEHYREIMSLVSPAKKDIEENMKTVRECVHALESESDDANLPTEKCLHSFKGGILAIEATRYKKLADHIKEVENTIGDIERRLKGFLEDNGMGNTNFNGMLCVAVILYLITF